MNLRSRLFWWYAFAAKQLMLMNAVLLLFSFFFFFFLADCGIGKLQAGGFEKWDNQGQEI